MGQRVQWFGSAMRMAMVEPTRPQRLTGFLKDITIDTSRGEGGCRGEGKVGERVHCFGSEQHESPPSSQADEVFEEHN